jgi:putative glycosyltransferase (TIGR04372 family)
MSIPKNININALILNFDTKKELAPLMLIICLPLTFIFGVVIFFLQRICRPIKRIRVGRINSLRVGHMLLEIDLYLTKYRTQDLDLFFFSTIVPVNQFIADFAKKKVYILKRTLLYGAYVLNRFSPRGSEYIVDLPDELMDFRMLDFTETNFATSTDFETRGKELLKNLKIPFDRKIVCFYVRDSKYGQTFFPSIDQNYAEYRDSNINDFVPAMEYLAEKGYTVIRMGKIAKEKIRSNNSNIIDYCFNINKSDFADFYLSYKSDFAICTDTGMIHFPIFLRKPIGIVNISGMHGLLHSQLIKYVTFKRYFDHNKERNLSLSEIIFSDLSQYKDNYLFLEKKISFVDSKPLEILGLVKEMYYSISTERLINSPCDENVKFKKIVREGRGMDIDANIAKTWLENNLDFLERND